MSSAYPSTPHKINYARPRITEWGFFGTVRHHADQAEAWEMAMAAIQPATGCPESAVRDFLDSTHGRHFADDVANGLVAGLTLAAATEAAVNRGWVGRSAGARRATPASPSACPT